MTNNDILWGRSTWIFLHTLAEKINENFYINNKYALLDMVRKICYSLPCPYCANHASMFINNVSIKNIPDKKSFGKMLFEFHNSVNKRENKPLYSYDNLKKYKEKNMNIVLDNFNKNYGKRYSITLKLGYKSTAKTRAKLTYSIIQWCRSNWKHIT